MSTPTRAVIAFTAVLFTLFTVPAVEAQGDTAAVKGATQPDDLCWRPRPAARCRAYILTEFGIEWPLSSLHDTDIRAVGTIGPMFNRGAASALGVALAADASSSGDAMTFRLEGRYRRWFNSRAGADFTAGLARKNFDQFGTDQSGGFPPLPGSGPREVQMYGLTTSASVDYGLIGARARVDLLQGGGESEQVVSGGVHLGGFAGPVSAVALVVGFFALFALAYAGG